MKKLLAVILVGVMALSLAACSSNSSVKDSENESTSITANDKSNYVQEWGTLTENGTMCIYISGNDDSYYTDENIGLHLEFSDGKEFIIYKDYSFVLKQDKFIESGEKFLSKVKLGRGIVDMKEDGSIWFMYYNDAKELENNIFALRPTETENEYTYKDAELQISTMVTTPENWEAYREAGYNTNAEYFEGGNYAISEYYENGQVSKHEFYAADGSIVSIEEYDENGNQIYHVWYNDDGTYTERTYENESVKRVYYNADNTIDYWEIDDRDNGGTLTTYYSDGALRTIERYNDEGEITSVESYHPDGYIQSITEYKPDSFFPDITYYNPDGTIKN